MSERSTRIVLFVLLALGVCGALAYIVPHYFGEWVEEEQEVGLSGAAAADPYLALARFLNEMGVVTETKTTLVALPPEETALLLLAPRRAFGKDRTRKVLDWVERGGHLLVAPAIKRAPGQQERSWFPIPRSHDEEIEDPLLGELGVERAKTDTEADPIKVRFRSPSLLLEVASPVRSRLEVEEDAADELWRCWDAASQSRRASVAICLKHGVGSVTIAHDRHAFTNLAIGKHDHVKYVWELVKRMGPKRAWIVREDSLPGMWSQLASWLWPALIGLALLLAAGLWRAWVRIGPVADRATAERRSLEEHLLAAGRFAWASGDRAKLLAPMRAAVLRRIRSRHPELAGRSPGELVDPVADLTGIPAAAVRDALVAMGGGGRDHFVHAVQHLERIRSHT